ncbi:hypothetical protein CVV65_05455 [Kyrpidia spormannii]|uniref:Fibronectin type-III domain-containing protein n=1 Tax=Kyrpidia spormannii TaxID=2055160 RepID=A0A2K8N7A5_9BACL|nr:hypothetical protein CVV65_05455 [Kyrpidia spormannii]
MGAYTGQTLISIGEDRKLLTWNPSPSPDTRGYEIYYGTVVPNQKLNVGIISQNQYTLDLPPGSYQIFIRTWDTNENYSDSEIVTITI